jgi:anaerobic C4-dicarboxylate transporter
MYWGLWLLPLGILVYKSGFLPRALGVFVLIAGCSYVADSMAYYFLPEYARMIANVSTLPQGAGEIGFTAWMLIKGVRTRPAETS